MNLQKATVSTTSFKGNEAMKRLRKFCKTIEKNMNNYINPEAIHEVNRDCKGYFMKIDSVNGIKKIFKDGKFPKDRRFFLRFFMTFYSQSTGSFCGNTYKSPPCEIKFHDTGHYELGEKEPLYMYFLGQWNGQNQVGTSASVNAPANTSYQLPKNDLGINNCILEIIFVEATIDNNIISQTCEGWGLLNISPDDTLENATKGFSASVHLGTPRDLLHKNIKGIPTLAGASIIYSCGSYREIEKIKNLLPDYLILGHEDPLPGVLQGSLPKRPLLNDLIRTVNVVDVYLKNVELEISANLEGRLISFANNYRLQKYNIQETNYNKVIIKERKLKCGVHNSWAFINSNGLENSITLNRRENVLFYKGVLHIDNFFIDDLCAIILELNYTLSLPISEGQREEILYMIMGYSILVPDQIDRDNNFRSAHLITGPGMTIYGEYLWDPIEIEEKLIKINFILSKSKESIDKTYKEKEIEELRVQMETMQKSMIEEHNKMLVSKDREKENAVKKMEEELAELKNKLTESQRSFRKIYDREPNLKDSSPKNSVQNATNKNKNLQFVLDEKMAATEAIPTELQRKSHFNSISDKVYSNKKELGEPSNIDDFEKIHEPTGKTKLRFHAQSQSPDPDQYRSLSLRDTKEDDGFHRKVGMKLDEEDYTRKDKTKKYPNERYWKNTEIDDTEKYQERQIKPKRKKRTTQSSESEEESEDEISKTKKREKENQKKLTYDYKNVKDISRRDRADLVARGVMGLDVNEQSESMLSFTLEKELHAEHLAHNFVFHFLAYKPPLTTKDYKMIPDKIFFKFTFWDFEFFTTSVATVLKPSQNIEPSGTPLVLQKEGANISSKTDEKEMKIQITFDPSADPCIDYKDFINFLLQKLLFVEIYDADKLYQIGFFKIPLKDLLRQGKPSLFQGKEYEIFTNKFEPKGAIQILLKSIGLSTYKPFKYDPYALKVVNTKDHHSNMKKKKKVHVNPMDLDKISQKEKEYLAKTLMDGNSAMFSGGASLYEAVSKNTMKLNVDPETEKKLRVMKYINSQTVKKDKDKEENVKQIARKMFLPEEKLSEIKIKQDKQADFYKTLNQANKIKELKRPEILSKTIQENNKNNMNISLVQGQPYFFNFIVYNNSDEDDILHIIITSGGEGNKEDTGDRQRMNNQEAVIRSEDHTVSLISSPEEWKILTESNKMLKPNDYNSISKDNYLIIKPNESIPLMIKLLSYDILSSSHYTIWVYKKNGHALYFLTLTIVKVFPIIDHVFKEYVPELRNITIRFPNPYKYDKVKTTKLLESHVCSDPTITLQLDQATNDFYLKIKSRNAGYLSEFLIFLYLENRRLFLYSTWKIEIQAMKSIDLCCQLGIKLSEKFMIESENIPMTIQFFSSHPEVVFFPEKFLAPIIVLPGMANEIKYIVYPKKEDSKEVVINCVDISNRVLFKSWLIRVQPQKPEINQTVKVNCQVHSVTNIHYEFTNSMNAWAIFTFESNNNDLLAVVDGRMPFNALERKKIAISIPAQNEAGRAEVLVFIADTDEMYSETILFQLNYM